MARGGTGLCGWTPKLLLGVVRNGGGGGEGRLIVQNPKSDGDRLKWMMKKVIHARHANEKLAPQKGK
jgi:hypothetical protein